MREIAGELEAQRQTFCEAITLLRRITAACPWELDAGGSPEFWAAMRKAQMLLREFEANGCKLV